MSDEALERLYTYVHWKGGIWKIIDGTLVGAALLRWVRGPRPDKGVLHWVEGYNIDDALTDMEVLGLMADNEIVP